MIYPKCMYITMTRFASSILLVLCSLVGICQAATNNVCTNFVSYNFKRYSKDCYHDPDADTLDPITIIRHHVPEVESYDLTTDDGYILTMFRLPNKNAKGVLWLQHPITADGTIWIVGGNDSLGFLAWNAGYDVWMPSHRGTTLSPGHLTLSQKDVEYWDYSFHKIAIFDYTSLAEFIYDKTNGSKSFFVGHSMSSTSSLVYASIFPQEAQKYVKTFINMGTPVYFEYIPSLITAGASVEKILKPLFNFLKVGGILRYDDWYLKLYRNLVKYYPLNRLSTLFFALTCGWTPNNWDPRTFGLSVPKYTRGLSAKIALHYFQLITVRNRFQQYDYGKNKNKEVYGTEKPPTYDLQKIITPFYFIYSDKDGLATKKDTENVYAELPKSVQHGTYMATGVNHLDYFLGKNRKEQIYDHLIDYLNSNV